MAKTTRKETSRSAASTVSYTVSGQVFNANNEPIMGQQVLAADVDLLGAAVYKSIASVRQLNANKGFEMLGTAVTDTDGFYEIRFTAGMFRRNEIGVADIIVFATDGDAISARSKLAAAYNYTGNALLHWDIQLAGIQKRGHSEYTRLMAVLTPFVKENGVQLFELAGSADQVSFLATETMQDPGHTSLAVQADLLKNDCLRQTKTVKSTFISRDIDFFSALFYGIGRQNIPLTWVSLQEESQQDLQAAIELSVAQNIIPPQETIVVESFIAIIIHIAQELSMDAPETAAFYKVVGQTLKDPSQQKLFAKAYMQASGEPVDFWSSLAQQPGFTAEVISSLQLTNQLSILTGQHTALIEALQADQQLKDPSDLLSLTTANWHALVTKTGVPANIPGDTPPEKAANYIEGMQNMLHASYPTQKIALMISNNELPVAVKGVNEKVAAFLKAAPDFDISTSVLNGTAYDSLLKKVSGELYVPVQQQLLLMQRLYQVSPTPAVMATLAAKGYSSAYHISSMTQHGFVSLEAQDLGGVDIALSVYNRARHQAMRSHHTLLKIYDTQDKATPAFIMTRGQQQTVSTFLTNLNK